MKKLIYAGALLVLSMSVAAGPLSVKVAAFAEIAIYPERSAPATVVSLNDSPIAAQIAARIEAIPVRVGDIVDKGGVLVRLDCSDFELGLRRAEAQIASLDARIELAQRRVSRTERLTRTQTVSEELLDERESDLAVLRADRNAALASMEIARLNQSRCLVKSPFRAVLTERAAAVGQYADVGFTLVRIVDLEQLEVSAQVSLDSVGQITGARDLEFEYDDTRYPVRLRTIVPTVRTQTRNREVRLLFRNGPALAGAAGKLYWRDTRPHVPGGLLVKRQGRLGVFCVDNGHARFRALPEAQQGRASPAELAMTTRLVTEGHFALDEGQTVTVVQ